MEKLKELLKKEIVFKEDTALMFSGGIDSCICFNLLKDLEISPTLYNLSMEGTESDDLKYYKLLCKQYNYKENIIIMPKDFNIKDTMDLLISKYNLSKRKKSSLLVLSLFTYLLQKVNEKNIYTGLGSDSYYGLGRDFRIQCSLKGEKIPSLESMKQFRQKVYFHYRQQYDILKDIGYSYNKNIITPFLSSEVFEYMIDKTYEECNKPKSKQILINLYPEFFKVFKARIPSNFQCGNSNFKLLLGRK